MNKMNLIFQLRWLFQDILSYNFESLISRSKKEFFHVFFLISFYSTLVHCIHRKNLNICHRREILFDFHHAIY